MSCQSALNKFPRHETSDYQLYTYKKREKLSLINIIHNTFNYFFPNSPSYHRVCRMPRWGTQCPGSLLWHPWLAGNALTSKRKKKKKTKHRDARRFSNLFACGTAELGFFFRRSLKTFISCYFSFFKRQLAWVLTLQASRGDWIGERGTVRSVKGSRLTS